MENRCPPPGAEGEGGATQEGGPEVTLAGCNLRTSVTAGLTRQHKIIMKRHAHHIRAIYKFGEAVTCYSSLLQLQKKKNNNTKCSPDLKMGFIYRQWFTIQVHVERFSVVQVMALGLCCGKAHTILQDTLGLDKVVVVLEDKNVRRFSL